MRVAFDPLRFVGPSLRAGPHSWVQETIGPVKRLFTHVGLCALFALGCGSSGVGDPCAPARPNGQPCNPDQGDAGTAGCFLGTEIYIETQSLQCRSRICLVYRFAEAASNPVPARAAAERAEHVYCTCRCGVPPNLQATTDPSVLCTCPDQYTCLSNLAGDQYPNNVRGSYCVRSTTVRPGS